MTMRELRRRWLGLVISLIAVAAAVIHVIWPSARIDGTTALLLGIALIPWLGELLESIELPGGLKVKYREIERRQDAVEASAREASSTAQAALGAAGAAHGDVEQLVSQFHELRARAAFPGRTGEMDRLFGALVNAVPADFDAAAALNSSDEGVRLAGYAYAYGRPDPTLLGPAADALAREETRFNQYWALRVLQRIVAVNGIRTVPRPVLDHLRALDASLEPGSNRRRPLTALLNMVDDDRTDQR